MLKLFKDIITMCICFGPLIALPTWFIVGMTLLAVYGVKIMLLPMFAILIVTWLFVSVYFERSSNMSEKENQKYALWFSLFNTFGLCVIIYFCTFHMSTIIEQLTPPIWK